MIREPQEALVWPDDFPPTNAVKKFFIGIRWLGPDLGFFKELRIQQAGRTNRDMDVWPTPAERQAALMMGNHFHRACGWKAEFFLPEDRLCVIGYGPRFQTMDAFDGFEEAIAGIEKELGTAFGDDFWRKSVDLTFGEVVRQIVAIAAKTEGIL